MQAQQLEPVGERVVVDRDRAALAAGQVLGGVEAEAGGVRQLARPDAVALAFDAVGRVLDQARPWRSAIALSARMSHIRP